MFMSCIELVYGLADEDYRIEDGQECILRFWIRSIKGYVMNPISRLLDEC